jgi:hypothetical protein
MSQRRTQILQAARMAGAAWHGSPTARRAVLADAPHLAQMLDELWEMTRIPPTPSEQRSARNDR